MRKSEALRGGPRPPPGQMHTSRAAVTVGGTRKQNAWLWARCSGVYVFGGSAAGKLARDAGVRIHVKTPDGKSHPLEVEDTDTVWDAARRVLRAVGAPPTVTAGRFRFFRGGGSTRLEPDSTISDIGIGEHETIRMESNMFGGKPSEDHREVTLALKRFLPTCYGTANGEFTYLSVGCHVMDPAKAAPQQCHAALLDHCLSAGLDLNIILIDPGLLREDGLQIYNNGDWVLLASDLDDRVRRYKHKGATRSAACDIWMTVFATGIDEYIFPGPPNPLRNKGKVIAGIAFHDMLGANLEPGGGAAVCGNFGCLPVDSVDASQYFAIGNESHISGAGFRDHSKYDPT